MTDFYFFAPTGDEIQGTSEQVAGAADLTFTGADASYSHAGDTKMFWDGAETLTIEGVPLFTCDSGSDWLKHHLVQGDENGVPPNPVSDATIDLIDAELKLGAALEAAKKLRTAYAELKLGVFNAAAEIELELRAQYRTAKAAAIAAIAKDLAA